MSCSSSGFTLIELLVTLVILGVLGAMSVVNFNAYRDHARYAAAQVEMKHLNEMMMAAKMLSNENLIIITGEEWGDASCYGVDTRNMGTSHSCYQKQLESFDKIQKIISPGVDFPTKLLEDPWGGVYMLDANEREDGGECINPDRIASSGPNGYINSGRDDIIYWSDSLLCNSFSGGKIPGVFEIGV